MKKPCCMLCVDNANAGAFCLNPMCECHFDNMTQNIREEFKKHINYEQGEAEDEYLMTLADWWIDKLNTTLKEIEEEVEKMRKNAYKKHDGTDNGEEIWVILKEVYDFADDIKQLIHQKLIK